MVIFGTHYIRLNSTLIVSEDFDLTVPLMTGVYHSVSNVRFGLVQTTFF